MVRKRKAGRSKTRSGAARSLRRWAERGREEARAVEPSVIDAAIAELAEEDPTAATATVESPIEEAPLVEPAADESATSDSIEP